MRLGRHYMNLKENLASVGKMLERVAKGGLETAAGVGMTLGVAGTALGDIIVRTVPEKKYLVADNTTEYKISVVPDTTGNQAPDLSGEEIRVAQWRIAMPDSSTFVNAELPDPINNPSQNPNDFFYNVFMDNTFNYVNGTITNSGPTGWTQATGISARKVDISDTGPSGNIDKSVGDYIFTVKSETPTGSQHRFLTANLEFSGPGGIYVWGSGVRNDPFNDTINQPYTVVPRGDANHNGITDLADVTPFVQRLTDPVAYETAFPGVHDAVFDFNQDGQVDGNDIQGFVDKILAP